VTVVGHFADPLIQFLLREVRALDQRPIGACLIEANLWVVLDDHVVELVESHVHTCKGDLILEEVTSLG
jgi:hypothetical protein